MSKRPTSSKKALSVPHAGDFREFLQAELVRRIQANPKYSLRAFASHLQLQSAFLSKLLRGERRITSATVVKLGSRLGLDPSQIEHFEGLHSKRASTSMPAPSTADYRQIALDHFQVLSEWYHFAILELSRTKKFKPSSRWIAASLGISAPEAQAAIDRLVRLNYLKVENGVWSMADPNRTTVGTELTSSALRNMQRQALTKGIDALEGIAPELRDQSTMTMAIDTKKLPRAKILIRNFRRNLMKYLEEGTSLDSVYNLSISFYPLTKMNSAFSGAIRYASKH